MKKEKDTSQKGLRYQTHTDWHKRIRKLSGYLLVFLALLIALLTQIFIPHLSFMPGIYILVVFSIAIGGLSLFTPWDRFPKDSFMIMAVATILMTAFLVRFTGANQSPFVSLFVLVIALSATYFRLPLLMLTTLLSWAALGFSIWNPEADQGMFINRIIVLGVLYFVTGSVIYIFVSESDRYRNEMNGLVKTLESQREIIRKGERLSAAVETVSSLSHELSQPLTEALLSADLLARQSAGEIKDTKLESGLANIRSALERTRTVMEKFTEIREVVSKEYLGDVQILDLEKSLGGPGIRKAVGFRQMKSLAEQINSLRLLMGRPFHNINNLLTLISVEIQLFRQSYRGTLSDEMNKLLVTITHAVEEISGILSQYFLHFRARGVGKKSVDLYQLIQRFEQPLAERLGRKFFLAERGDFGFRTIQGCEEELENAVFSLLLAIGEKSDQNELITIEPFKDNHSFGFQIRTHKASWSERDEDYLKLLSGFLSHSDLHLEHELLPGAGEIFRIRSYTHPQKLKKAA